ncbi:MAG TPA: hypothetical protein VLL97_15180 [Acidobacteriota bacterium]|nr:hypothetical protein [Acidobacteriota bacterium]
MQTGFVCLTRSEYGGDDDRIAINIENIVSLCPAIDGGCMVLTTGDRSAIRVQESFDRVLEDVDPYEF